MLNARTNDFFEEVGYGIRDECFAVVTDHCWSGNFVQLDDGEDAFAAGFHLRAGSKVLCSVRQLADEAKHRRKLVSIDHVVSYAS